MRETFDDLLNHVYDIWHRRKLLTICAWLLIPIGFAVVSALPNTYKSTARVYVDTDSILAPLLEGMTVEVDDDKKVNLMVQTLLGRSNLERIARMADMDHSVEGDAEYEFMLKQLSDNFYIKKERSENIYSLAIQDLSAERAKRIVESALNVFIDNTIVDNRKDSNDAVEFIDQQIRDYEARLLASEKSISDFKRRYSHTLPDFANDYYQTLNDERQKAAESVLEYEVLLTELEKAKSLLFSKPESAKFSFSYEERILGLQRELDTMQIRFTHRHPDVIELKERINVLQELHATEIKDFNSLSEAEKSKRFTSVTENDVLFGLQNQINELETKVHSTAVRMNSYQKRVKEMESRISEIPAIEAQLTSLRRDYEINKEKYEDLLSRKETALLASNLEENTSNIRFEVLDPPNFPLHPEGPKRLLYLTAVVALGYGLGIGLAFLIAQTFPTVNIKSQKREQFSIPVIGEIPLVNDGASLKREKIDSYFFWCSLAVFVLVYISLVAYFSLDKFLLIAGRFL